MTPFGELPQWMDIGPDQDFAAPATDLVGLLKKRMGRKPQGGIGSDLGGVMGNEGIADGKASMKPEGMNSL